MGETEALPRWESISRPEAMGLARELDAELGAGAEFLCSDVYELPGKLDAAFEIVFASYGVLCWLPDLAEWGKVIRRFLATGWLLLHRRSASRRRHARRPGRGGSA